MEDYDGGEVQLEFEEYGKEGDPRLLFANFTSSLLIVNSTLLLYALAGIAALAGLAYLFYYLSTQNSGGGGGYGSYSSSYGSQYSDDEYGYRRFKRETADLEWIRILSLLEVSSQLYTNMSDDNMSAKCPQKFLCQAFESPDIFGGKASYLSKIYQLASSINFKPDMTSDLDHNFVKEDDSSCKSRYWECEISLPELYQEAFEKMRNAKL